MHKVFFFYFWSLLSLFCAAERENCYSNANLVLWIYSFFSYTIQWSIFCLGYSGSIKSAKYCLLCRIKSYQEFLKKRRKTGKLFFFCFAFLMLRNVFLLHWTIISMCLVLSFSLSLTLSTVVARQMQLNKAYLVCQLESLVEESFSGGARRIQENSLMSFFSIIHHLLPTALRIKILFFLYSKSLFKELMEIWK